MIKLLLNYLSKRIGLITLLGIIFILSYLSVVFFPEYMVSLTYEDGPVENLGAVFFLITSILLLLAFIKTQKLRKAKPDEPNWKNFWILALCLLFFLAFGEEISWGQRIFNFNTPESLSSMNVQGEFNLHNLEALHGRNPDGSLKTGISSMFTMHALFYEFLLVYMVIIPILVLFSSKLSRLIVSLGIPIVPLWMGVSLVIGIFFSKLAEYYYAKGEWTLTHTLVEIKETNIALVIMLMGFAFLANPKGECLKPDVT